jgi:hypothetical protein
MFHRLSTRNTESVLEPSLATTSSGKPPPFKSELSRRSSTLQLSGRMLRAPGRELLPNDPLASKRRHYNREDDTYDGALVHRVRLDLGHEQHYLRR